MVKSKKYKWKMDNQIFTLTKKDARELAKLNKKYVIKL